MMVSYLRNQKRTYRSHRDRSPPSIQTKAPHGQPSQNVEKHTGPVAWLRNTLSASLMLITTPLSDCPSATKKREKRGDSGTRIRCEDRQDAKRVSLYGFPSQLVSQTENGLMLRLAVTNGILAHVRIVCHILAFRGSIIG